VLSGIKALWGCWFVLKGLIFWQFGNFFIPLVWVMARGGNMVRPEVGLRMLLGVAKQMFNRLN
jgi:hypothetical protein